MFEPGTDEPLYITPGTTVRFVWKSDSHSVTVDDQPKTGLWAGHTQVEDEGFEHEYTFDVLGTYEFYCTPHESVGMTGTIVVTETGEPEETTTEEPPQDGNVVEVAPGGEFEFAPNDLHIDPGETVTFVWRSDNHNLDVTSVPEGATWEGHTSVENTGFEYEHTFETEGVYEFQCDPHSGLGAKGRIVVGTTSGPGDTCLLGEDCPAEILVGADGSYVFEPGSKEPAYTRQGTTITFRWDSDNHNLAIDAQPDGSDWEGHETVENAGFELDHTFEVSGTYEFACRPHESLGETMTLVVEPVE